MRVCKSLGESLGEWFGRVYILWGFMKIVERIVETEQIVGEGWRL